MTAITKARTPNRTYSPKAGEVERRWYVVDAAGVPLGRLATRLARILTGKDKPTPPAHRKEARRLPRYVAWPIPGRTSHGPSARMTVWPFRIVPPLEVLRPCRASRCPDRVLDRPT